MKNAIVSAVTVSAVLFFGYYLVEGIQVANKARNFGGELRQEMEAIGNAPVQTKAEKDALEATVTENVQVDIKAENAQVATQELSATVTENAPVAIDAGNAQVKTQAQMDAEYCVMLEEVDTPDMHGVCIK